MLAQKKSEELVTIISVKVELDGRFKKMCTKGVSARFIALISGKKHLQRALISCSKSLYLKSVDFSGASL